ncbi:hypothetical protein Tsubulata_047445 [Turnera subulata]|uniref:R13L1/DRL21-like LRR repeat region domain-containing protein n=1 Tax=Turnera subulata TaxID=218843 RepID=A0A9Q0JEE4_9ROSI|nr:hypothetical protein Tsubulata_047445 [Turnera subulata]
MDLSGWLIDCLPKELCNLHSLQTLILRSCRELVKLPDLLGNLKNLRYLDLNGTGIVRLPTTMNGLKNLRHLDIRDTKISKMPPQLAQLTKLVVLTDFFIGKGEDNSIAELGPLERLKGQLCIWNLENVVDPSHAIEANLKGKRYIEELGLRWGDIDKVHNRSLSEQILEQLQPSNCLKALEVHNYPGVRFPNWLGEHCFSMLTSLHLRGASHCSELPALGQLELLKELKIAYFDSIVRIGPEFYGNSSNKKSFPSLEKLTFSNMPRLQQLTPPPIPAFPLLQKLCMEHCPVPESDLNILLEGIESLCLEELDIRECSNFVSLPGQGLQAPNLRKLQLQLLPSLEGLPKHMNSLLPSLTELTLACCTKLRSFPEGGLPSSLEKLEISLCSKLPPTSPILLFFSKENKVAIPPSSFLYALEICSVVLPLPPKKSRHRMKLEKGAISGLGCGTGNLEINGRFIVFLRATQVEEAGGGAVGEGGCRRLCDARKMRRRAAVVGVGRRCRTRSEARQGAGEEEGRDGALVVLGRIGSRGEKGEKAAACSSGLRMASTGGGGSASCSDSERVRRRRWWRPVVVLVVATAAAAGQRREEGEGKEEEGQVEVAGGGRRLDCRGQRLRLVGGERRRR